MGTFLTVRDEAPGRVTGAVFMGQGAPFHSFDAVIQAAYVLSNPAGGRIAREAVTISTAWAWCRRAVGTPARAIRSS